VAVSICSLLLGHGIAAADSASDVQAGIRAFDHGSDKDAWNYFEKAAREGNTEADYWLGRMSELGLYVKSDPQKAAMYYKTAAEAGWSIAKAELGHLYLTGEGVSQDYMKAKSSMPFIRVAWKSMPAMNLTTFEPTLLAGGIRSRVTTMSEATDPHDRQAHRLRHVEETMVEIAQRCREDDQDRGGIEWCANETADHGASADRPG
jgi:Sel1 repeat